MSFLWKTNSDANIAEQLLAKSKATAEARKLRIEKVITPCVDEIMRQLFEKAGKELSTTRMLMDLENIFNFSFNKVIKNSFTENNPSVPDPTKAELVQICELIKTRLKNSPKYGLQIIDDNASETGFIIDWSEPISAGSENTDTDAADSATA